MITALLPIILAPTTWTLQLGSLKRTALVYAPRDTKDAPVVIGFHGHGGGSRQAARSFGIHQSWPEAIVVYPQGLPTKGKSDPEGKKPGWQKQLGEYDNRDLEFVDAILSKVKNELKADPKKIFAMGHSNGGAMTYFLWATRPDDFAAFGPSGAYRVITKQMKPRPIFHIAGTNDPLVSFEFQERSLKLARSLNGCTDEPVKSGEFMSTYASKSHAPVVTYFTQQGHKFPTEASAEMVKFFKQVAER
ncbi:MAG: prolyl oligopeptidase family serine peptidase [Fimbriimonadaceae bacterium]